MKIRDKISGRFGKDKEIWVNCALCGKPKQVNACDIEHSRIGKFFCSKCCYDEYRRGKEGRKQTDFEKELSRARMKKLWEDENWRKLTASKIKKRMSDPDLAQKVKTLNSRPRAARGFEAKCKQSDALVGKFPSNFRRFATASSVRSIQKYVTFGPGRKFFMRSTWERNIARYFEYLQKNGEIKEWEYEPQRFFFEGVNFGNRTYLPDFRITDNSGYKYYVEVKGFMNSDSKTKLKRMKKYFPEIELQIIDQSRYAEISRIAPILPEWEWEQTSKRAQYYIKKGLL